ncbi:aromatic ring-hydroxylating dioxygenase subunit alpha [Roseomonas aeriglobus]|nr:aromatic ring-hydroxylating dioxygenase subunit alpha [Roseomonas aeriglobus]
MEKTTDTQSPPPRKVATLETLNASQIAAIRAIPEYNTVPPPVLTETRPVSIFLDQARFDQEQASIFRKLAVPVTLSAALPEPGSVIGHEGYGLPLIVARAKDGKVRAFLNACKHKGSKLVEDCAHHKMARLTCPYHAWTYGLDGRLLAVARGDAFEAIDKADYALTELACREHGGIVWVSLNRHAEPDFSALMPELEDDLNALGIPGMTLYGRKTFHVKANWKLVLEPFMESYHVPRLHAGSIGELFGDVTRVIDQFGPHQRKIAGKIRYKPEMLDLPGENIHKTVTHAYQIFPNAVLITSPYYMSFMTLMPKAPGETIVEYFNLVPGEAPNEKVADLYRRSYELVLHVFGNEDFRAAEISHAGLASGALDVVTYGGMENTIPMYYEQLEARL